MCRAGSFVHCLLLLLCGVLLGSVSHAQEGAAPAQPPPPASQPAAPAQPPVTATPEPPPPPSLDKLLEDLAKVDPAALAERLAQTHTRIQKLKEESDGLKAKIAANEADVARLSVELLLLDALVKVRGTPAPGSPTPPPAAPAAPPPAAPAAPPPSAEMKTEAAPPMAASAPASSPSAADGASTPAPMPAASGSSAAPQAEVSPGYKTDVYPIFADNCLGCHNPDKAKGGLVLDSLASTMQGGGSGAVILPGNPDQSRLFRLVSHLETPTMPPMRSKLPDDKLDVIRRWILAGAPELAAAAQAPASPVAATTAIAAPGAALTDDVEAVPMPTRLSPFQVKPVVQAPPVVALAVSPVAPLVAAGSHGQVMFFHLEEARLLGVIDFGDGRVSQLAFSADGARILAAGGLSGKSGRAALFEVESGRMIAEFGKQYDAVLSACLSPDGTLVAVGGCNRKVRVYDAFSGALMFEIGEHNDWVEAVAFSPDGLYLATADRAGALYLWESDTGRKVCDLRGHQGAVHAVAFFPDSSVLASAGRDGTARLWSVESGQAIRQLAAHGGDCLSLAVAGDGRLATCGADGRVRLWRGDGQEVRSFESRKDWAYQVSFSPDGRKLVAGDWSGGITFFDVETGAILATLSTRVAVSTAAADAGFHGSPSS